MEINKIYLEDNIDTIKKMPNEFIDLVVTSPPYDGLRKYNGFAFDMDTMVTELFRAMKKGGVIVWVVNDQVKNGSETGSSFITSKVSGYTMCLNTVKYIIFRCYFTI